MHCDKKNSSGIGKQKVFKNKVAKETTYNTDYFFTALSQAISLNSIILYTTYNIPRSHYVSSTKYYIENPESDQ